MDALHKHEDVPDEIMLRSVKTGILEPPLESNTESAEVMDTDKQPGDSFLMPTQSMEDYLARVQMENVRMRDTSMNPITTESVIDVTAALLPSGGTHSHFHARRTIVSETRPIQTNENVSSMNNMDDKPGSFQSKATPKLNLQSENLTNSTLVFSVGTSTHSSVTSDSPYDKEEVIHSPADDEVLKTECGKSTHKTSHKVSSSVSVTDMPKYVVQPKERSNRNSPYEEVKDRIESEMVLDKKADSFIQSHVLSTIPELNKVFDDELGKDKESDFPSGTSEKGGIDLEIQHLRDKGISEIEVNQEDDGEIIQNSKLLTTIEIEKDGQQVNLEMSQPRLQIRTCNSKSLDTTGLPVGISQKETCFQTNSNEQMFTIESQEPGQMSIPTQGSDNTNVDQKPRENEEFTVSLQEPPSGPITDDETSLKSRHQPLESLTQTLGHVTSDSARLGMQSPSGTDTFVCFNEDHISKVKNPEPRATSTENLVKGLVEEDLQESSEPYTEKAERSMKDWIQRAETQESFKRSVQTDTMKKTIHGEVGKTNNVETQMAMQHQTLDCTSVESVQEDSETDLYLLEEDMPCSFKDTGQQVELLACSINMDIGIPQEIETNHCTLTAGEAPSTVMRDGQELSESQENVELPGNQIAITGEGVEPPQCDDNSSLQYEVTNTQGKEDTIKTLDPNATASVLSHQTTHSTAAKDAQHANLPIEEEYGKATKELGQKFQEQTRRFFLKVSGHNLILFDSGIGITSSGKQKEIENDAVLVTMKNGSKLGMKFLPSNVFLYYHYGKDFYSIGQFGDNWYYAKDTITQQDIIMRKVSITTDWVKIVRNFLSLPDYPRLLVPYAVIYDRLGFIYFLMGYRQVLALGRPPEGYHFNKLNLLSEELRFLKYCKKNSLIPENIEDSILYTNMGVFFDPSSLSNFEDPCIFKKYIKEVFGLLLCDNQQEHRDLELLTERAYECLEEDAVEPNFSWLSDYWAS